VWLWPTLVHDTQHVHVLLTAAGSENELWVRFIFLAVGAIHIDLLEERVHP